MRLRIAVIILAAIAVGVTIYLVQTGNEDSSRFTASGTIEAVEVDVASQSGGELIELKVEEGDTVEEGDVLAKVDDTIAKSQVDQAEAADDLAELRLKSIPAASVEREAAELAARQAQTALEIAREQLKRTVIKAPIAGTVLTLPFAKGESLSPGAIVAVLADLDKLNVTVYVPERHLGEVKLGEKPGIEVDSFPGKKFSGKVAKIADEPEFTPTNVETKEQRVKQVYAVKIKVANKNGQLKPGMPADVDLKLK